MPLPLSVSDVKDALGAVKDTPLWILLGVGIACFVIRRWAGLDHSINLYLWIAGTVAFVFSGCRLVSNVWQLAIQWWKDRDQRKILYITPDESKSFWYVAKQPDGSVRTQIAVQFRVKNLVRRSVYIPKVSLQKPKIEGLILRNQIFRRDGPLAGSAADIPFSSLGLMKAVFEVVFVGELKTADSTIHVVAILTDELGKKIKLKANVRKAEEAGIAPSPSP